MSDGPVWDETNNTIHDDNIIFDNPYEPWKNLKNNMNVHNRNKGTATNYTQRKRMTPKPQRLCRSTGRQKCLTFDRNDTSFIKQKLSINNF